MRKVLVLMAFSPLFFACGSGDNNASGEKGDTAKTEQPASTASNQAELDKGAELIAGSNCLTCHKINEKIIGPTYMEVAQKYEATDAIVDTLATKVIKGGSGVWGNVPMTPHPELSMDTARMMVRYILSLRK
jgi:cytochrome c